MAVRWFRVVALRGAAPQAPENTPPAFAAALDAGADELAADVRATKDGAAVLFRDPTLARWFNRDTPVRDLTLKDIQQLPAPAAWGEAFRGLRIPSLDEFVAAFAARAPLQLALEDPAAILPVIQTLQRFAEQGAFERVQVASAQRKLLASLRVLDGRVRAGIILEPHSTMTVAEVKHFGAATLIAHIEYVDKGLVDEAHKLNLTVQVWGLENLDQARRALAAGADAASTERPSELVGFLRDSGVRANGNKIGEPKPPAAPPAPAAPAAAPAPPAPAADQK